MQGVGYKALVWGCRVQGVGYKALVWGCRVQGVGYKALVWGCRVQGAGLGGQGTQVSVGCRHGVLAAQRSLQAGGCRVHGQGFRVWGFRV